MNHLRAISSAEAPDASGARDPRGLDRDEARAYESSRVQAMRLAGEGAVEQAFQPLNECWRISPPSIAEQGADLAWLYLLAGEPRTALTALDVGTRGHDSVPRSVREVVAACVVRERALLPAALRVCLRGGSVLERLLAAAGALRAFVGRAVAPDIDSVTAERSAYSVKAA